jgi:streptogrisin C
MEATTRMSKRILSSAMAALTILAGATACGSGSAQEGTAAAAESPNLLQAYAEATGLTEGQAKQQLAKQKELGALDSKMGEWLKPEWSAGTWIDQKTGRLKVAVTNEKRAEQVRERDGEPQLVKRSADDLDALKAKAEKAVTDFHVGDASLYEEVSTNKVIVTAKNGSAPFAAALAGLGDGVELRDEEPTGLNGDLRGGDLISGAGLRCTAGFAVVDAKGDDGVLTAGHCVESVDRWSHDGQPFGRSVTFNNDSQDWGLIGIASGAASRPVALTRIGGSVLKVGGVGVAPVGAEVCKQGITTSLTCGPVVATDVVVTFNNGKRMVGMNRARLVADFGDSGAPLFTIDPDDFRAVAAQGLLTGSPDGTDPQEITTYQPITSALTASGTKLSVG